MALEAVAAQQNGHGFLCTRAPPPPFHGLVQLRHEVGGPALLQTGADDVGKELAGVEADLGRLVEEEGRGHHAARRVRIVEVYRAVGGVEAVDAGVHGKTQFGEQSLGVPANILNGRGGQIDRRHLAAAAGQVFAAVIEELAAVLDDLRGGQGHYTAVGGAQDDGAELLAIDKALHDHALLALVTFEQEQGVTVIRGGPFEVVVKIVGGIDRQAVIAADRIQRKGDAVAQVAEVADVGDAVGGTAVAILLQQNLLPEESGVHRPLETRQPLVFLQNSHADTTPLPGGANNQWPADGSYGPLVPRFDRDGMQLLFFDREDRRGRETGLGHELLLEGFVHTDLAGRDPAAGVGHAGVLEFTL